MIPPLSEQSYSAGDLLSKALRAMEHDELPPATRAAFGVVIAARGDRRNSVNWEEAAEIAGMRVIDLRQALIALREQNDQESRS